MSADQRAARAAAARAASGERPRSSGERGRSAEGRSANPNRPRRSDGQSRHDGRSAHAESHRRTSSPTDQPRRARSSNDRPRSANPEGGRGRSSGERRPPASAYPAHGNLPPEAVRTLHQIVKQHNSTSSNPISKDTFVRVITEFHRAPDGMQIQELRAFAKPEVFAELLFVEFDPEDRGTITWDVLIRGVSVKVGAGGGSERTKWAFRALHPDPKGRVNRRTLHRAYRRTLEAVRDVIAKLDGNKPFDARRPGSQVATILTDPIDDSLIMHCVLRAFEEADTDGTGLSVTW